jgi:pimeloyl-ACP methyl ester carboxylesterase
VDCAAIRKAGLFAFKRNWFEGLIQTAGSRKEALRKSIWQMIDEWQMWQPLHIEPRLLLGRMARATLKKAKPAAPVLIIRGDRERVGFSITDLLPRHESLLSPICGHVSNLERPEAFTAALTQFLQR